MTRDEAALPTPHPAGSPERLAVYIARSEYGLPLHMPGDNTELVPITHDGHKCIEINTKIYRDPR